MFPKKLDGAEVIYYTAKREFGTIYYTTGEIFDYVRYLAIGRYANGENEYYLFGCSDNYDVISDFVLNSIAECIGAANSFYGGNILWIKANQ